MTYFEILVGVGIAHPTVLIVDIALLFFVSDRLILSLIVSTIIKKKKRQSKLTTGDW